MIHVSKATSLVDDGVVGHERGGCNRDVDGTMSEGNRLQ